MRQFLALAIFAFFVSCTGGEKNPKQTETGGQTSQSKSERIEINAEAKALLSYLEEMGDYVNSRNFPSLIKASSVYDELEGNIHIIDLRGPKDYANGHIKGAVNIAMTKLPDYFTNNIKPFEYDRIVLVCFSGQISSYSTSLLRLMGYGNVYAMRWGMSGWDKKSAESTWLDVVSSKFENQLELDVNEKSIETDFPEMNTTKSSGEEILTTRFNSLFEAGFVDAVVSADQVFKQPDSYYIINYDRRDKYEAGHIPGAIRYKPNGTLGIVAEMQTIPPNKEVVVYCGTGHNSSFATAYLRLFGYNAKTLMFGNNSFMHSKMIQDKSTLSWLPFTENEIGNYPLVKN
ncbi:rhodanese-like domain-containing protein [Draconibacterium sp.]|nr:rhodanese-like domain-containing protein [Draconibacterium sp.]